METWICYLHDASCYVLLMDKSGLLRRAIRSLVDKKSEDKAMEVFKKSMKQLDTGGVEKQHSVHVAPCVQNVINGLQGRITLSPFICSFLGDSAFKSSLNEADISASKLIKKVEELSMQMVYNYGSYFLSHYPEANQIYGRDKEIVQVLGILSRRRKTNTLLVGDSGGGKTAVVAGLARRVARGEVPPNLLGLELISLNMRALLQGRDQTRFLKEVAEAKSMILFIDDFHILIGAHNSKNAALVLKEILDMSHLLCIGATTVKGHREYTKADDTLERRFKVVRVPQPTIDDTLSILRERKSGLESQHRVRILDSALVAVVNFSSRYLKGRCLPDKAIDLLDDGCGKVAVRCSQRPEEEIGSDERRINLLELERRSLLNPKQEGCESRVREIHKELEALEKQHKQKLERYNESRANEREMVDFTSTIIIMTSNTRAVVYLRGIQKTLLVSKSWK